MLKQKRMLWDTNNVKQRKIINHIHYHYFYFIYFTTEPAEFFFWEMVWLNLLILSIFRNFFYDIPFITLSKKYTSSWILHSIGSLAIHRFTHAQCSKLKNRPSNPIPWTNAKNYCSQAFENSAKKVSHF